MINKKIIKFSSKIIFVALMLCLLTALGCKKEEDTANTNATATIPAQNTGSYSTNQAITDLGNSSTGNANQAANGATDLTNTSLAPVNAEVEVMENSNSGETEVDVKTGNEEVDVKVEEGIEEVDNADLAALAEKLAEIYGTYTNRDSYKNLKDLEGYVTPGMQTWLDSIMAKAQDPNAPFFGVTVKALSAATLEDANGEAKVLVTVKKEQISSKSNNPITTFEMLLMEFVKEGEEWKLNSAYWQK